MKNKRFQKGFTLFVSLIVTSLLLAIAFSLSDIVLKQLIFSQSARQSQISFYAADSGAECALYWDKKNIFGTSTPYGAFATSTQPDISNVNGNGVYYDILCGYGIDGDGAEDRGKVGSFFKELQPGPNVLAATTTFYVGFQDDDQNKSCAKVTVAKWLDVSDPNLPTEHTRIDSRGYDAPLDGVVGLSEMGVPPWGEAECKISSNRVIERAVVISY